MLFNFWKIWKKKFYVNIKIGDKKINDKKRCLMCEEYDLCDDCFNNQLETKEHKTTHPTTLILNSSGTISLFQ